MATFSKSNFKSLNYNTYRPHYPASFYRLLANYASKKITLKRCADLGCGTGVASYPLLNICENVIGIDLSPNMIDTANSLIESRCKDLNVSKNRISFKVGSVESLVSNKESNFFGNGDFDLITAAQCIHWFQDLPSFFKSSAKSLKAGGTLAYWYYVDPIISEYSGSEKDTEEIKLAKLEKSRKIIDKYLYDDPEFAGPHWEQPGRNILRDHLEEVNKHIPKDLFEDIVIKQYHADPKTKPYPDENSGDLYLVNKNITLCAVRDYIATNSGYFNYKTSLGDKAIDIPQQILNDWNSELGWDENTKVDFVYQSGYVLLRRK